MGHKASGPRGKNKGNARITRKVKPGHRARKRVCIVLPPGDDRHPNHAARRARARAALREAAEMSVLDAATRPEAGGSQAAE